MLFGLGSLLLWSFLFLGAIQTDVEPRPAVRIALGVFLFCVGISYVLAMSRPMSSDEISPATVALLALASWSGTLAAHPRRRLSPATAWTRCSGALPSVAGSSSLSWTGAGGDPPAVGRPDRDSRSLQRTRVRARAPAADFPSPAGTSIHPIEFGVLLAMLLPIALHVGFFHTSRPSVGALASRADASAAIIPLTSSDRPTSAPCSRLVICMMGGIGLGGCGLSRSGGRACSR